MNAGSIIDKKRLMMEASLYPDVPITVHPLASRVLQKDVETEASMHSRIGSTSKGTGAAQASKIMRDPNAVMMGAKESHLYKVDSFSAVNSDMTNVFVEVSQGYSLSLNSAPFYPYCTSRDCTVSQAMSDAGLHPTDFGGAMMVVRTYPIRVHGQSGGCYVDQKEIDWLDIGVEPELTTVTQKQRRIFTWSDVQFLEALRANRPNMLMINFLNYLPDHKVDPFIKNVLSQYHRVMGQNPDLVLGGWGPYNSNVHVIPV